MSTVVESTVWVYNNPMALAQKLKDPKWRREVEKQIKNRQITHGRRGHAASAKYTDWTARWAGHYQKGSGPRPARKLRSLSEMSASEYMFDHQGQQSAEPHQRSGSPRLDTATAEWSPRRTTA